MSYKAIHDRDLGIGHDEKATGEYNCDIIDPISALLSLQLQQSELTRVYWSAKKWQGERV